MIRTRIVRLACVVIVATPLTAFSQVRDGQTMTAAAVAPAPAGTGAISGIVMSADGAPRPLRTANVVLIGMATGVLKVTSTDSNGKFAFAALPPDRYTVGASKAPFLGAVAGARRPARPGTGIVLTAGQKVSDVVIRLPPAAAISGVITDEFGKPVQASVAVQQRKLQNGERVLVSAGNGVTTDERGRYRVYGLPPGEYVLSAFQGNGTATGTKQLTDREVDSALRGVVPPQEAAQPLLRYLPTYYPGTSRPADAGGLLLAAGDERTGVDVRLDVGTMGRIDGTVMTSEGQVPPVSNVRLTSVPGSSYQTVSTAIARENGRFSMAGLMPGPYVLSADSSGPSGNLFASQLIDVNGDQTDVQLTLKSPMTLKGRIVFDGTSSAPPLNGWQPSLKAMARGGSGGTTAASDATGAFTVQRLPPGSYIVNGPASFGANANTVTWSLQSVVADGKDITDRPIDLTSETLPKDVVVTFSDKSQSVTGRLLQTNGAPATDYTVIVFPTDKAYWLTGSRRIVIGKPDSNGQFTLGGPGIISLPPGEYLLAAVTDLDRDEQFDPALLASLVGAAAPLTIKPGERKVQDLVIR